MTVSFSRILIVFAAIMSSGPAFSQATPLPANQGMLSPCGTIGNLSPRALCSADIATPLLTPGPIGSTTANTIAATTLSASGVVSGVGFSNFLLSPPPIGTTTPNTVAATALSASGNATVNGILSNSGGTGYVSTVIDNTTDDVNGIQVTGTSTTELQERTKSPIQVNWNPSFTGTPAIPGNTAAITGMTTSSRNDQLYPWGIIGVVNNHTDVLTAGNPNAVAVNGTTFTYTVTGSQASSSWGGNFVCDERNAAPIVNQTHYCFGTEIDLFEPTGAGTDTNAKRIGLFIGAGPTTLDTTVHIFAGLDIGTNGTIDNGITFYPLNVPGGNITTLINVALGATHFSNFLTSPGFNVDNKGNLASSGWIQSVPQTFASLPACNVGLTGARVWVSDNNTAVAYRAVITGGGATPVPAICNGGASQWIMD